MARASTRAIVPIARGWFLCRTYGHCREAIIERSRMWEISGSAGTSTTF